MHLDLKPDNILIGSNDFSKKESGDLHLIDFGISKRYVDSEGTHIPFKEKVRFAGNLIFASKNAFTEYGISRYP